MPNKEKPKMKKTEALPWKHPDRFFEVSGGCGLAVKDSGGARRHIVG